MEVFLCRLCKLLHCIEALRTHPPSHPPKSYWVLPYHLRYVSSFQMRPHRLAVSTFTSNWLSVRCLIPVIQTSLGMDIQDAHPISKEFWNSFVGSQSAGISEENGGRQNLTFTVSAGQTFVVPQGKLISALIISLYNYHLSVWPPLVLDFCTATCASYFDLPGLFELACSVLAMSRNAPCQGVVDFTGKTTLLFGSSLTQYDSLIPCRACAL